MDKYMEVLEKVQQKTNRQLFHDLSFSWVYLKGLF